MNYSASPPPLLRSLGEAVRALRAQRGMTRRALSARARVSERFLVQLEAGEGNISVLRLQDVADALGTTAAGLLATSIDAAPAAPRAEVGVVALLGLRGAGKSTIGRLVADRLGVRFLELDELVAKAAGMSLATVFEIHGESWFRRLERDVLERLLDEGQPAVVATSGSIVTDRETFALLRARTTTVWLKARPQDHWDRVVAQGDGRPMKGRADAMSELEALLRARKPLYAKAAHVIDTSALSLDEAVARICASRGRHAPPAPRRQSLRGPHPHAGAPLRVARHAATAPKRAAADRPKCMAGSVSERRARGARAPMANGSWPMARRPMLRARRRATRSGAPAWGWGPRRLCRRGGGGACRPRKGKSDVTRALARVHVVGRPSFNFSLRSRLLSQTT